MNAGREVDALVAERVMGWTNVSKEHHWNYVKGCPAGWPDEFSGLPPDKQSKNPPWDADYTRVYEFSTELWAAWTVVEQCLSEGLNVSVQSVDGDGHWTVCIGEAMAEAATVPLAICLAALKAHGVEVGG